MSDSTLNTVTGLIQQGANLGVTLSFFAEPPYSIIGTVAFSAVEMLLSNSGGGKSVPEMISESTALIEKHLDELEKRIPGLLEKHELEMIKARNQTAVSRLSHMKGIVEDHGENLLEDAPEGSLSDWFTQINAMTGIESDFAKGLTFLANSLKGDLATLPLYLSSVYVFVDICQWAAALDYTLDCKRYLRAPDGQKPEKIPSKTNGRYSFDLVPTIADALNDAIHHAMPHVLALNQGVIARLQACEAASKTVEVVEAVGSKLPAKVYRATIKPNREPYIFRVVEIIQTGTKGTTHNDDTDLGAMEYGVLTSGNARLVATLRNAQLRMKVWEEKTKEFRMELYTLEDILKLNHLLHDMHQNRCRFHEMLGREKPESLVGIYPPTAEGQPLPYGFQPPPQPKPQEAVNRVVTHESGDHTGRGGGGSRITPFH